jgi:hypothetical protein
VAFGFVPVGPTVRADTPEQLAEMVVAWTEKQQPS